MEKRGHRWQPVVSEVRLYVEGGGQTKEGKANLRQGFGQFLKDLVGPCRDRNIRWNVAVGGGRDSTYKLFANGLRNHPSAFCVLLVDSEDVVQTPDARTHLSNRDPWDTRLGQTDQYHLMAVVTETWFLADVDALKEFYGQAFKAPELPSGSLEAMSKSDVYAKLKSATKDATTKGEYHKGKHAHQILKLISPAKVRSACPHCERLFSSVLQHIAN